MLPEHRDRLTEKEPVAPSTTKEYGMKNSMIFSVGVNDADYEVYSKSGEVCPYYKKWRGIMQRCYSSKYIARNKTYKGCSVAVEWHSFIGFKKWMKTQDWRGKVLDKDIMNPGNKIYSPETCVFVSQKVNTLLKSTTAARNGLPMGVSFCKRTNKYAAIITVSGKVKYLGQTDDLGEADSLYREAKRLRILTVACCESDIRVKQGLYRHSELLRESRS